MSLTRRAVLIGAAGAAVVAGTAGGVVLAWWEQPVAEGFMVISAPEAEFLDAFAEAVYPSSALPGGGAVGAAAYIDGILLGMVPFQRNLVRLSMHALDAWAVARHGRGLAALPVAEATALINGLFTSATSELRGIVMTLHLFSGMAWFSHPAVAAQLQGSFRCGLSR